ncbi:hypothetical protein B0T22DRAFT_66280 [Podospora appendiculata]|uniref:Uncharacterized protein n=1 Tax=Podospora appendiculata TaxID=314037 RepID=A0AAE1CH17_9PEZI|nr:hypothetical protein B0T22DRAFT_66280 [Podospora appendiculata]
MNTVLLSLGLKQLTYREIKPKASMTDNDAAIAAGFHFFIIGIDNKNETRVVMDYLFGTPKQQAPVQPGPEKPDTPAGPKKPDTPSDPPKPSSEKRSQAGEIEMTPLKKREYHAPSMMAPSQASTADTGPFSDDDHGTHGGFHPTGKTVFDDGDTGDEKPSAKQHVRTNPASQVQPGVDPVVGPVDKPVVDPKVDPKPGPIVKPDDKTAVTKKGLGRRKYPGQVAPYKTQQNILTISNLGLEYSNNTILPAPRRQVRDWTRGSVSDRALPQHYLWEG